MSLVTKTYLERRLRENNQATRPRRLTPPTGRPFPWEKCAFGCSVNENAITVTPGRVVHGTRWTYELSIDVPFTTIVADHTWIFCRYTLGESAYLVASTTAPIMSETIIEWALHKWRLIDGVASVEKIYHLGDIFIPGNFA